MNYHSTLRGERFAFHGLQDLFAKANEEKSGDSLAGIAARSDSERAAARFALADITLREIVGQPLIDPSVDDVSSLLLSTYDQAEFSSINALTVGEFREWLLTYAATDKPDWRPVQRALTPEVVAAVTKLMGNKDLVQVAQSIRNVTRCRNTLGEVGVLGVRIQPNHPTDQLAAILLGTLDGLQFGCGDAVIGINPAIDSVETVGNILRGVDQFIDALKIPTQGCCLAHVTTQMRCMEQGDPVDLVFQSIAGTQKANASFGVSLSVLREAREMALEQHASRRDDWVGNQVMYFETGQGSALSADAHHGIDQLTLEARAYGLARTLDPFLVNSVVGFIGPEYLFDERQIIRAGLEDHFMGKLLGLPMGCDVCYTNHARADENSADNLLILLAAAGCNYFMGVPCSDDVMLNYQSTSYHDVASIRRMFGLRPAPEFAAWYRGLGLAGGSPSAIATTSLGTRFLSVVEELCNTHSN